MSQPEHSDATFSLSVGGPPIHVRDAGPRESDAVLIVNGSAANLTVLDGFITILSRTHRVIAFDQPGMGGSPAVYPTPLVPDLALLCARLVRELGVQRVTVIGYSFGGAVAEFLALTRPDLVKRLVLISAVYGSGGIPTDPVSGLAVLAHQSELLQPWVRTLARHAYGGGIARDDEALRAYEEALDASPPNPVAFLGQAVAVSLWSALPWLWAIRCPTLVLTGSKDHVVLAANSRIIAALVPKARLEIIRGAGHMLVMDQAEDVAAIIERFLADSAGPLGIDGAERSAAARQRETPTLAPVVPVTAARGQRRPSGGSARMSRVRSAGVTRDPSATTSQDVEPT